MLRSISVSEALWKDPILLSHFHQCKCLSGMLFTTVIIDYYYCRIVPLSKQLNSPVLGYGHMVQSDRSLIL